MNAKDVLKALTRNGGPFCRRRWIAVPNVYWGWGLRYEADLIAVSRAGICCEIEIKVSRPDLKQDRAKRKFRQKPDPRIQKFYYAVPEALKDLALETIPPDAGLVVVRPGRYLHSLPEAELVRSAKTRKGRKPTPDEIQKLQHLGLMRYWDLVLKSDR